MSVNQFTQRQNAQMLWDVISDEEIFRFLSPDIQSKIRDLFLKNIVGFYEMERMKTNSLVDLNKKYILLILSHIKKTYTPNKIKIHNEVPPNSSELITYEEIQNDRRTQFEKDFARRQEEFDDSINVKAPPKPDFSDKQIDQPIGEIDKMIKEMQAKRNYDIEQINKNNEGSTDVNTWLKPQETSLKKDKFKEKEPDMNTPRFKYLNELETPREQNKKVSFSNNDEFFEEADQDEVSIFSKLKPIQKMDDDNSRIYNLERNVEKLNEKMDKIISLLSKHN